MRDWLKNIVVVMLLNSFLELLLPSGKLKAFVKVVLGLFFLMVILQPFWQFLDLADYRFFLQEPLEFLSPSLEGDRLEKENRRLALEHYGKTIAKQIESFACTLPDIEKAFAQVYLDKQGELKEIWLRVNLETTDKAISIQPIVIGQLIEEADEKKEQVASQLKETLSQFYRLPQEKIELEILD